MFDSARYLRKLEIYLIDPVLYPDELRRLHIKVAGVHESPIHATGKARVDAIVIGEDMGRQHRLLSLRACSGSSSRPDYTSLMGIARVGHIGSHAQLYRLQEYKAPN